MEAMKQSKTKAQEVVDGHDMNQDLHQILGYTYMYAQDPDNKVFDSGHMSELALVFLQKYRELEVKSPKGMQNSAYQMKALIANFKNLQKRHRETSEKLDLHEHYMRVIKGLNRTDCLSTCDNSDYFMDSLSSLADRMEEAAKEYLTKPESFDDISDDEDKAYEATTPRNN